MRQEHTEDVIEHIIYTDGSCLKNPGGPGGWAFLSLEENGFWCMVGNEIKTTNNRMELQAVIEALNHVNGTNFLFYTDSQWLINCATGKWKRKANLDQWEEYDKSVEGKKIKYVWVKGHSGDKYNEIVDDLARKEAELLK